jgi:hypothetical protein
MQEAGCPQWDYGIPKNMSELHNYWRLNIANWEQQKKNLKDLAILFSNISTLSAVLFVLFAIASNKITYNTFPLHNLN